MSMVRTQGSFVAIRTLSPSSSLSRCPQGSASTDDATCGTPTWIGKGLTCVCFKRKGNYERICINLTPLQEERLKRLKHRMKEALRALWSATYPGQELHGLISNQWNEMGWQGRDPSTDFRGAGFISLENLLFFAKTFSQNPGRLSEQCSYRCCQDVLRFTRTQLERELLMEDVLRIEDMPSYSLLC